MTCPVCHSPTARRWCSCHDHLMKKPLPGRTFYRCLSCDLVYLSPQTSTTDYEEHYGEGYISHKHVPSKPPRESYASQKLLQLRGQIWQELFQVPMGLVSSGLFTRWMLLLIRRSVFFRSTPLKCDGNGKKLLDVGSGAGQFLTAQSQRGWNVHGLEPAPRMVEESRARGLDVRQGFSIAPYFPTPTFHFIVLNQVFEHLTDPQVMLKEGHDALRENGILYMNMPNARSLPAWLFRGFWFNLDAPRHNLLFSPSVIRRLLVQENFEVLMLYTSSSTKGFTGSIEYLLRDVFHLPLPEGSVRKNKWFNRCLVPFVRLIDWFGVGDNLHVIARKKSIL